MPPDFESVYLGYCTNIIDKCYLWNVTQLYQDYAKVMFSEAVWIMWMESHDICYIVRNMYTCISKYVHVNMYLLLHVNPNDACDYQLSTSVCNLKNM